MMPNQEKLARHLDGPLSTTGVTIGLSLVASGIGGLLALASGAHLLAVPLLAIFLLLLTALAIAVGRTDPTLRMTPEERKAKWNNVPLLLKWSILILMAGGLFSLIEKALLSHASAFPFGVISLSVSTALLARYVAINRPPLPTRTGRPPVTEESEPDAYRHHLRSTVLALSLAAILSGSLACLMVYQWMRHQGT